MKIIRMILIVILIAFMGVAICEDPTTSDDTYLESAVEEKGLERMTEGESDMNPAYWYENDKVIFIREENEETELYYLDVEKRRIKKLLNLPGSIEKSPAVSPDGKYIAFVSAEEDSPFVLCVYNTSSGTLKKFTFIKGSSDFPRFTEDGRTIVFANDQNGDWDIYSVDVDGKNYKLLLKMEGNQKYPNLVEGYLYFTSDHEGFYEIYRKPLEGGDIEKLTDDGFDHSGLIWEPSERFFLYSLEATETTIWMADKDFVEKYQITFVGNDYSPAYDPDRGYIYFESDRNIVSNIWKISYTEMRLFSLTKAFAVDIEQRLLEEGKMNIVFLDPANISSISDEDAENLINMLAQNLIERGKIVVLDREKLEEALEELRYNQSDLVDPNKRKKVGKFLKVEAFVFTIIKDINTEKGISTVLQLKIVDAFSSRLIGSDLCIVKGDTSPPFFGDIKKHFVNLGKLACSAGLYPGNTVFWKVDSEVLSEDYTKMLVEHGLQFSRYLTPLDRDTVEYILNEEELDWQGYLDPHSVQSQEKVANVESVLYGKTYKLGNHIVMSLYLNSVVNGTLLDVLILPEKVLDETVQYWVRNIISKMSKYIEERKTAGVNLSISKDADRTLAMVFEDVIFQNLLKNKINPVNRELMSRYREEELRKEREIGLKEIGKIGKQVGIDIFVDVKVEELDETYVKGSVKVVDVETLRALYQGPFEYSSRKFVGIYELWEKAVDYFNTGKYKKAGDLFYKVYAIIKRKKEIKKEERKQMRRALRRAIESYHYAGEYRKDMRLCDEFIKRFEEDHDIIYYKAYAYYGTKQYDNAEKLLRKLIEEVPYYYKAYVLLAKILVEKEKFEEALLLLFKVPETSDYYTESIFITGLVFEKLENWQKAMEYYKKCFNTKLDREARFNYVRILFITGELQEAFEETEEIMRRYPKYPVSYDLMYKVLVTLFEKGFDLDELIDKTEKYVEKRKANVGLKSIDCYFLMILKYEKALEIWKRGKEKEARKFLEKEVVPLCKEALALNEVDNKLTSQQIEQCEEIIEKYER